MSTGRRGSRRTPGLGVPALLLVVVQLLLVGCTHSTPPVPSATGTIDADHVVTAAVAGSFGTLDPARATTPGDATLVANVYQTLLAIFPGRNQPEPDLAEACKFSLPTVYTCRIRDKSIWSDGTPVTPVQVKASFDRLLHGPTEDAALAARVDAVTAVDEHSVDFELPRYDAILPYLLATPRTAVSRRGTGAATEPGGYLGSGPYRVTSFAPASRIVFAANDGYAGRNKLANDGVVLTVDRAGSQPVRAVVAGSVELAFGDLDPDAVDALAHPSGRSGDDAPVVTITPGPAMRVLTVAADTTDDPSAVQQAMSFVIDRSSVARAVTTSTGQPQTSVVPAGLPAHVDAFDERYGTSPDIARAAAALQAAGIRTPVPMRLACGTGDSDCSTALRGVARELTASKLFTATVRTAGAAEIRSDRRAGRVDGWWQRIVPAYPDADAYLGPVYEDVQADALARSRRAAVPATRTALVEDIQRAGATGGPAVPLVQERSTVVAAAGVTGVTTTFDPAGVMRFWTIRPPG